MISAVRLDISPETCWISTPLLNKRRTYVGQQSLPFTLIYSFYSLPMVRVQGGESWLSKFEPCPNIYFLPHTISNPIYLYTRLDHRLKSKWHRSVDFKDTEYSIYIHIISRLLYHRSPNADLPFSPPLPSQVIWLTTRHMHFNIFTSWSLLFIHRYQPTKLHPPTLSSPHLPLNPSIHDSQRAKG